VALAIAFAVALVLYGNLVAFRAPRSRSVVAMNLAIAASLVAIARITGISWHALGLDAEGVVPGLLWGGILALVVVLVGAVILLTPLRRAFRDVRAVEMRPSAFQYLVRIPFGTALPEEAMFRGVLLAALAGQGLELGAVLGSSVAFGLWHVGASLDFLRANQPRADVGTKVLAASAGVLLTTVAGAAFAVLRVAAESLLAPILVHAAINAVSLAVARAEGPRGPKRTACTAP
jgi:membrane protease YdiL (CAAX protease family)